MSKNRPARIATQSVAGGEKTIEHLKEDLRKTRDELVIQKWGLEKTLKGMKALVRALAKELLQKKEVVATQKWGLEKTLKGMKDLVKELIQKKKELEEAKAKLEESNKKLQKLDKAKTEFISIASHQLRTPLTTISWYTEMILHGDAGQVIPGQKKYLEEIYWGNSRMIELVNTLLDVSRLELGTFKVEPKPTDIITLAQSVLDEQKSEIEKKKIIITKNFNKDIPLFSTDPKLLRMVFQNLLANAVEYTPEGGKIEFTVAMDDPPSHSSFAKAMEDKKATDGQSKKTILIKVSDTGYGIPKNQQDKIFTKFFRADNVRDKDTDGTGLGLYIVKSIVENSGGKIWFDSVENKGTTFYVNLPLDGMKKKEGSTQLS